ncbi:hypothetical protein HCX48_09185 [Rhodocyclus tenuis]|uniref:Uncharacterized protein n=1 Tax=Rhodocyclus gracilis TaxID=2929842 RepID=A0ABX0WKH2_9RHOO|nr:hypothetical protein [Rhodocyclus gracilis]
MNGLVLSGVPGVVLSGVALSCYQACELAGNPVTALIPGPSNFPNLNSLTNKNSAPFRWKTSKRHGSQGKSISFSAKRAAP